MAKKEKSARKQDSLESIYDYEYNPKAYDFRMDMHNVKKNHPNDIVAQLVFWKKRLKDWIQSGRGAESYVPFETNDWETYEEKVRMEIDYLETQADEKKSIPEKQFEPIIWNGTPKGPQGEMHDSTMKSKDYATSKQQLLILRCLERGGFIDISRINDSMAKQAKLLFRLFNRDSHNTYSNLKELQKIGDFNEKDIIAVRDYFKEAEMSKAVDLLNSEIEKKKTGKK
jgi:hypothetical protein